MRVNLWTIFVQAFEKSYDSHSGIDDGFKATTVHAHYLLTFEFSVPPLMLALYLSTLVPRISLFRARF